MVNDRCAYNACTLAMGEEDVTGRLGGGDKRENEVSHKEIATFLIVVSFLFWNPTCTFVFILSEKKIIKENMAFVYDYYSKNPKSILICLHA